MTDHTRFGYYCSLALHITVTVAAIISVLMKSVFKTDDHPIDPKQVFEMVEPAPETPVAQQPQQDDAMPQIEQQKEIAAIVTHTAFYAGWPKAWAVFNLAKEVWGE